MTGLAGMQSKGGSGREEDSKAEGKWGMGHG
jgi:hypothetical protein